MSKKLKTILARIIRDGLLEDRLEYDVLDLAKMYELDREEATELKRMIQETP